MPNLLSSLPATLPDELTETLVPAKHVRIERIVSQGHASPEGFWYDQRENEFVLLVQGAARVRFEDKVIEMKRCVDVLQLRHADDSWLWRCRP